MKALAYISKEKKGYSIYLDDSVSLPYGLAGEGNTVKEAIADWESVYSAMRDSFKKKGLDFQEVDFEYTFDIPSFLDYYGDIFSNRGFAKKAGIAPATLSHYSSGFRHPSPKTTAKLQEVLHSLGRELCQIRLI